MRATALTFVLLLGACSSATATETDLETEEATLQAERDAAAAKAQAALMSAREAYQAGDPLTAFSIANRALLDDRTPEELRGELRRIRAESRSAIVVANVCRVSAVPDRDAVADGDTVLLRVQFRNLTSDLFVVPRSAAGSSVAQLLLEVTRNDFDVYGNSRASETQLRHELAADLSIPPGGVRAVEFALPDVLTKLDHQGFSIIEVGGTFRPVVLHVGETEFFDALAIEPASVHVFQKGYEHLATDPLGSLEKAVEKRSPPHILIAAELLPATAREQARAVLEKGIEADPELSFALQAALKRIDAHDR